MFRSLRISISFGLGFYMILLFCPFGSCYKMYRMNKYDQCGFMLKSLGSIWNKTQYIWPLLWLSHSPNGFWFRLFLALPYYLQNPCCSSAINGCFVKVPCSTRGRDPEDETIPSHNQMWQWVHFCGASNGKIMENHGKSTPKTAEFVHCHVWSTSCDSLGKNVPTSQRNGSESPLFFRRHLADQAPREQLKIYYCYVFCVVGYVSKCMLIT